jgi:anti-sigma regulatory factor (Ser/Thr protein kinase)
VSAAIAGAVAIRASAADRGEPARLRLGLSPVDSAAATARRLVDRAVAQWGLPTLRDTARLVVTELVSNAVRHGTATATAAVEVTLARRGDAVYVSVRDRSHRPPRPGGPVPATVEGGRGLLGGRHHVARVGFHPDRRRQGRLGLPSDGLTARTSPAAAPARRRAGHLQQHVRRTGRVGDRPGAGEAMSVARTCAGVAAGSAASTSAAAPATCGAAIDVPLDHDRDVGRPAGRRDGHARREQVRRSRRNWRTARGRRPGRWRRPSTRPARWPARLRTRRRCRCRPRRRTSHPTRSTPAPRRSARSDAGPPTLMSTTAGRDARCAVTQSTAAMTSVYSPQPSQPNARNATTRTPLATPVPAPPIVPATWVPWPWQSSCDGSSSTKSQP